MRTATLIVDVQADFLPGGALAVADGDEVIKPFEHLVQSGEAGDLVICSRDWHPADHLSFASATGQRKLDAAWQGLWPDHCVAGTPGAELDPRIAALADWVFDKATVADQEAYSAFSGTPLATQLREAGIGRLLIGGLATDYCVLNTALDALREGFEVVLLTDAVRAVDPEGGRRALAEMQAAGAELVTSDQLLAAASS